MHERILEHVGGHLQQGSARTRECLTAARDLQAIAEDHKVGKEEQQCHVLGKNSVGAARVLHCFVVL